VVVGQDVCKVVEEEVLIIVTVNCTRKVAPHPRLFLSVVPSSKMSTTAARKKAARDAGLEKIRKKIKGKEVRRSFARIIC